jgi:hypothetical protein
VSDWIEHDGGPQPVADDVWVERPDSSRRIGPAHWFDWTVKGQYPIVNQHLINAARLEGIRLGLEAAARAVDFGREISNWQTGGDDIRALDPATIAREAVLDKLASEAQKHGMGYE